MSTITSGLNTQMLDILKEQGKSFSEKKETAYGWKIQLTPTSLIICIKPGHSTSAGIRDQELDALGLRPHPGAAFEKITVLGYEDGLQDDKAVLSYTFRPRYEQNISSQNFSRGSTFYSVQMDKATTGYWHSNRNVSDRSILLFIESGKKTYGQEVAELNVRYEDLEAAVYANFMEKWGFFYLPKEARGKIMQLDDEYARKLAELDEQQKSLLALPAGRETNPMVTVKHFEKNIGAASEAHAQKVKDVIRNAGLENHVVHVLLDAYEKDCVNYFNPVDGMLSRYYNELDEINARYGMPLSSSVVG